MRALTLTVGRYDHCYYREGKNQPVMCTGRISMVIYPDPAELKLHFTLLGDTPDEQVYAEISIGTPEELTVLIGALQAMLPALEREIDSES
ncbi:MULTISPECIES: hypothetical protein [Burkholderia cepacia complex]|uniref:Uncharacterized protein n=1 Tax=Burkholderia metallica TaxID=488729 RepID=A0ABT8PJG6_9BURK|nr:MULTISPECIES: hypothetical protein [Burkholderia cepacia complex]MCA8031991.1 hypothetical protein [Burkholderia arboris]MDN7935161.1 hypothetical protein [Burkholderia metallica]